MSVSEAFRGVVDESMASMELAPGKALATGLVTMLRGPLKGRRGKTTGKCQLRRGRSGPTD